MEKIKSDCKGSWVGQGIFTHCPIHEEYFKNGQACKFYQDPKTSDGTAPDKKVEPIKVEQGVYITNKGVSVTPNKLQNEVLSASKVSHAFRFTVILKNPPNWNDRDKICRSKGLNVERRAGIGRVFMTSFKGHKIWLSDKSITIYFPEWRKYYVDEARTGLNFAIDDLRIFLDELAIFCDSNFLIDDTYRFRVGGQHHALIYNSLAKMYNRDKKKLNVYDKKGELWLVIDNSRRESIRMDDIETVKPETAVRDMDDVVSKHFNDLRDNESYPPSIVKDFVDVFKEELIQARREAKEQYTWMAENWVSHRSLLESNLDVSKKQVKVQDATLKTLKAIRDEVKNKDKESRQDKARKILRKYGW